MKTLISTAVITAATVALISAPTATASPGQCASGSAGFGGGGFCDSYPYADGTWDHCEEVYVMGFGGRNCFRVKPVPVEVDPRGWAPA